MKLRIHSFADVDRSGKVRWTALELGCEIEEERLSLGAHREEAFRALNPYGQVPAVEIDGEVLIESSAICRILVERLAGRDGRLAMAPEGDEDRATCHQWCSLATETLEYPAVMVYLSRRGLVDARFAELLEPALHQKLLRVLERLPGGGTLVPGQFTLADIFLSYALRLAVQGEVIAFDQVASYLEPLMARPAAVEARFFDSLRPAE